MFFPELHMNEINSMKFSKAFLSGVLRRIFCTQNRKIFVIGFHKTGTSSLGKALQVLGYKVCGSLKEAYGYKEKPDVKEYILNKARPLMLKYDAFQDTPWFILYKELYRLFPDSYFILTVRQEEQWLKSVQRHFGDNFFHFHDFIYGTTDSFVDSDQYLKQFNSHNQEVKEFFKDNPNFMVFDVSMNGWKELCNFLGVRKPIFHKFPNANKASQRNSLFSKVKKKIKGLYYE